MLERLNLRSGDYFLVSAHREENVDPPGKLVASDRPGQFARWALRHSGHCFDASENQRNRMDGLDTPIVVGLSFTDLSGFSTTFISSATRVPCLSDSGTITEESSILNFPALNLREVNERPEGFEEGAVMMVGLDWPTVESALAVLEAQPRGADRDCYPW